MYEPLRVPISSTESKLPDTAKQGLHSQPVFGSSLSLCHFFFFEGGLHPQHMDIPRLGVESELQLPAYATATATTMPDLSHICDLYHSS